MPDLIVSNATGDTIAEIPLGKQGLATLGRSEGNDLVIDKDSVSRRHAIVFEYEDRWFAADLGSRKGLSNEMGSTRFHEFKTSESWVQMGPAYLWLHGIKPATPPERPELAPNAIPGPIHLPGEFKKSRQYQPAAADTALSCYLVFQKSGGPPLRMLDLAHVDRMIIGRGRTCDLVLD
ncbi:MAG: FHA domain-containing protein, partial [Phycisphaerales bacterium]|nr:FHA domain-containing protein [Phycisphaerales bacterium]